MKLWMLLPLTFLLSSCEALAALFSDPQAAAVVGQAGEKVIEGVVRGVTGDWAGAATPLIEAVVLIKGILFGEKKIVSVMEKKFAGNGTVGK